MKAVTFDEKFICFSFVIEDDKRVVTIMLEASVFGKITFLHNIQQRCWPKPDQVVIT